MTGLTVADHYNISQYKAVSHYPGKPEENFKKLDEKLYYVYNKHLLFDFIFPHTINKHAINLQKIYLNILSGMNLNTEISCPIFIHNNDLSFNHVGLFYYSCSTIVVSIPQCNIDNTNVSEFDNDLLKHMKINKMNIFEKLVHVLIHELQHFIQFNITKKMTNNNGNRTWEGKPYNYNIMNFINPFLYNNLPWEKEANAVSIAIGLELYKDEKINFMLKQ